GGTIGGPLYIPGHYNTNKTKTFFFVSEEFRRRNVGAVARGAMIPQAMRNGDFTNSPTLGHLNPNDPTSPKSFVFDSSANSIMSQLHPGANCLIDSTHVNPACFDANAVALMNRYWPLPNNVAAGFDNYLNSGVELFHGEDHTYRIANNVNQKLRL